MITANQWYNIAQTAQVGTKSGIRIDFGTKYALFKVSVDYGNAVIAAVESNITAEETRLSVRIRYNNSAWFVDVRFSVSQETTLSAATYDNTGWEAVSPNTSVAGNTICIINDLTSLIRPSGGGESLFELINVGTAEVPRFAVVPKKYNGVEVGIISNTFISMAGFEEPDDDTPVASSSLGDLLDVQITDPKSKDVLTYDEDLRKWVNGPGGLDETALGNYLTTNKYITQDALTGALNGYVTNEIYNTAITALNLRLTELETTFKEWFYYDDVNKAIRTKLSLIVDGTLSMGELGSGGGTEVASGKLADLLDVQITDPASGQILLYNEEKGLWVNGSAGLNEEQLEAYLKGKDYATNSALSSLQTSVNTLRTDFDNLNNLLNTDVAGVINTWYEVVDFLNEYSGSENLATILSGINTNIANNANNITSISNRIKTFEDIIGIDSNGDVYIKGTRNFYTEGGTISMFGLGEGDSGEVASVAIKFEGSDVLYNPINGVITLPAYPSGGGVADSVDWANVANKPTTLGGYGITDAVYGSSGDGFAFLSLTNGNIVHYGDDGNWRLTNKSWNLEYVILHHLNYSSYALPLSGGVLSGNNDVLTINGINNSYILFNLNMSPRASVGYYNNFAFIASEIGGYARIGIADNGEPQYWPNYTGNTKYTLIHSGNIGSQSVNYANNAGLADYSIYTRGFDYTSVNLDLNNLSRPMFWYYGQENSGLDNIPLGFRYGGGITFRQQSQTSLNGQFAWDVNHDTSTPTRNLWFRVSNNLGWGNDWKTIAFTDSNVASADYASSAGNAEKVAGLPVTNGNNQPWNSIPAITSSGYMDVGKHFEFHYDNTTGSDYSTVLMCTGNYSNIVNLPSASGTLALLTDNVASATKLQTGRYFWGNYFNGESDVNGGITIRRIWDESYYTEGIRVVGTSEQWCGIFLGTSDSYSGVQDSQWNILKTNIDTLRIGRGASDISFLEFKPNGNVLIGTTIDSGSKVTITTPYRTSFPSLGSLGSGSDLALQVGTYYGLYFSINAQNGSAMIQNGCNDGTTYTYPILLNPLGGNVLIGTAENDGHKLRINGEALIGAVLIGRDNNAIDGWWRGSEADLYLNYTSTRNIRACYNGGNVIIGNASDNGAKLQVNGSISLTQGASGYISAGGGYSPNNGKYGVKILVCDQSDAQTGLGQNCFGAPYELSLITTRNGNYGQIAFGYHYVDNNTYTRVGYFDVFGNFIVTGTAAMGTLSSSSDARLKNNIKLLTKDESLAVLRQLRPSKWNWKSNGALSYGFIAQEVEGIASCMVDRMNDEELGQKLYLQYNQLHAFEVGAIQHIDSEVEQLKRDLNTANLRIKNLENELKQYRLCQ